jgi:hypothetical protein
MRKLAIDTEGRPSVTLMAPGRKLQFRKVHQLLAEAFLGPRPEGMEVCHGDGNLMNCTLENLRYDTRGGNERDKRLHGTHHNSVKTHCPWDHEYTPENTYIDRKGSRNCRTCKRKGRRGHLTTSPAETN